MLGRWVLTAIAFFSIKFDAMSSSGELSKLAFLLTNPLDPDLYLNTMEFVCLEGYPVQQHKVISQDGYIINIHRIPNGNRKERVPTRQRGFTKFHHYVHPDYYSCINESLHEKATGPPVLMQHGLLAASDSWVLRNAKDDLAYLLADAGYDVWMSDARGNYYSRSHLYKDTRSKEFWDFSFHEIAYYDLPAVIDYILEMTNHKQVYYIGHSMGTVVFFVLGATRPDYMSKVRLAIQLAPVANVTRTLLQPPRGAITNFIRRALFEFQRRQRYEFAPRVNWVPLVINRFCSQDSLFQDVCYDIGVSIDGHPYYNLVRENFARVVSHFLSGTSTKTMIHFYQVLKQQRFQQYDYGEEENFRRYDQVIPPEYDVTTVSAPVALLYSDSDLFEDVEQVEHLATLLPNVAFMKKVSRFLHTDFIVARNAKDLIYDDVLRLIRMY